MQEQDLTAAIREHVSTGEPPMSLTSVALLARGRRERRRRTAVGVSAGALAAVAVAGVLTVTGNAPATAPGAPADLGAVCPELRGAATGPARSLPPATAHPVVEATVLDRLDCALARAVTRLMPDARFAPAFHAKALRFETEGAARQPQYVASAEVYSPAGRGNLDVLIFAQVQPPATAAELVALGQREVRRVGPHGEVMIVGDRLGPVDEPGSQVRQSSVYLYTGRTVVAVRTSNEGAASGGQDPSGRPSSKGDGPVHEAVVVAPVPPLTVDQLADIAADPDLAIYG
ncbi:hypothetical protein OG799_10575 [Micromonospora sp. NBC_00898]|uniref:hypothetical protein n=1 Tax=Micromonospora sp. NBC_00898 TaxID=2975981 RepID=UPI00386D5C0C|nr:hypothetical protein OG799_10575 [Micromonospora sp. NBC_00898]